MTLAPYDENGNQLNGKHAIFAAPSALAATRTCKISFNFILEPSKDEFSKPHELFYELHYDQISPSYSFSVFSVDLKNNFVRILEILQVAVPNFQFPWNIVELLHSKTESKVCRVGSKVGRGETCTS